MIVTRRDFLRTGVVTGGVVVSGMLLARRAAADPMGVLPREITLTFPPLQDPRCKQLVSAALEVARASGATYADARLTHTFSRSINPSAQGIGDSEAMAIGVRALVDGVWGFASSALWSTEEAVRLGREAVAQAKANVWSRASDVGFAPAPVVQDGQWATPVRVDLFAIPPVEFLDYLRGLSIYGARIPNTSISANRCAFVKQDKAFASTEGSYYTHRSCLMYGHLDVQYVSTRKREILRRSLDTLTLSGGGFELYDDQPIRENIRQLAEELRADMALPMKPVTGGRYAVVLDASSVSRILDGTIGAATELDRVLGFEANADGTSYLNDPLHMSGTYRIGAPVLTITANRTELGGAASVQWDDDGAPAQAFPLVQDGILVGYQTTREGAHWLSARSSTPVSSRGCAYAGDATVAPLTHTANLTMRPGDGQHTFDTLVEQVGDGVAFRDMAIDMDFHQGSGSGGGMAYEVKNGKRTARLDHAMMSFRATELWNHARTLGGTNATRRYGMIVRKGEPAQDGYHSVTTVPVLFDNMVVADAQG